MEVVALLLSGVAALAAVGAWLSAVSSAAASDRSATAAEHSATEAKRANYLAARPVVTLASDGEVHHAGLRFTLTCDRDLDTMHVELVKDWLTEDERQWAFRDLFRQGVGMGSVTLHNVRAGQAHVLHAFHDPGGVKGRTLPPVGLVNVRCVCARGDEEWVVPASTGPVEMRRVSLG
ncbi:hypothetical protein QWY28_21620 [Nocardioides sp. SOB77]|uniref:Uncharacterized protein n=1 Tax=Nocardioides oceani TaxID=3058369 RepID=A0ABT8FMG0_9ACTN|nr:hypothetical protein [Nocardioides oceani]MDN4175577.1 hypothetical protein [Nocardioides oceani]